MRRKYEAWRRRTEKRLIDGIWNAEIGDFDIRFKIGGQRYKFKAFSIMWILTIIIISIIGVFAMYAFMCTAIILGG